MKSAHRRNNQWCERHWAPYLSANADGITPNGLFAAVRLIEEFINSPIVAELSDKSPEALNRVMKGDRPVCCRLGDAIMDKILVEATKLGADS